MAKLRDPLLSFDARGRLGKHITFLRRRKINLAERTPVIKDAKTLAQLSWRHMYQKAVALWQALSSAEKQEWESLARPKHMTGFAWFISQALKPNPGLYLPLQGGTMTGDVDMAGFRILDLIDPTLDQEPVTRKYFEDNLPVGGYTEGARVWHNLNQNIPHNTWTTLAFNSEDYDTNEIHDPVTNNSRLTCKTAGKYLLIGNMSWGLNVTGLRSFLFLKNGVTYLTQLLVGLQLTGDFSGSFSCVVDLAVNDFIEVQARQTSGNPLAVVSYASVTPYFMIQRIG